jgi:hypothetical protein
MCGILHFMGLPHITYKPHHFESHPERGVDADDIPAALSPDHVIWLVRDRQTRPVQTARIDAIGETCRGRANAAFSVSIAVIRAPVCAVSTMVVPPFPQPSSGIFSG